MTRDAQGHELSGANPEAAAHVDRAVRAFTLGYGDPIGEFDAARRAAPGCTSAYLGKAWVLVLANDPGLAAAARPLLDAAKALAMNEREKTHLAALEHGILGHRAAAVAVLDRHLMQHPHDLLAHFAAMLGDAFLGRFPWVAERSARALPRWSRSQPGYGILLSFYGFGLEEAADYARSEATSRAAAELEPYSYWPHHAVSHVMEMTGRPEEGLAWMAEREPLWSTSDHAGQAHIWWHKALFHVELGQYDAALAIYDGAMLATQKPVGVGLTNAPALLWRLEMLGCATGDRWQAQAAQWIGHADGRFCLFADIHAAMAEIGAGHTAALGQRLAAMQQTAADGTESAVGYRDVGLPVVEGLSAYRQGDYDRAVEHLLGARYDLWRMGGSKAQRDVIDWTLADSAIRAGLRDCAVSLAHERLGHRPQSVPNRRFLSNAEAIAS